MRYVLVDKVNKFEIYKEVNTSKVYLRPCESINKRPYTAVTFTSIKKAKEFVLEHCK